MASGPRADARAVERLPGLLGDEAVYWIEHISVSSDGRTSTELGFSDSAAHPYQQLVAGTVEMLRVVPGVEEVIHEDREVVLVTSRGLAPEQIADIVDRYWYAHLPTTPIDPGYDVTPGDLLTSPWPAAPPPPRGAAPAALPEPHTAPPVRAALTLPPTRWRMWTYLICGAIPALAGIVSAINPGGSNGLVLMLIGAVNLAIGGRIAYQRHRLTAARP